MLFGWLTTKMNGWEPSIYKLVRKIRQKEMKLQRKASKIRGIVESIIFMTNNLLLLIVFLPAYYTYGNIDISLVLSVIGIFGCMGDHLVMVLLFLARYVMEYRVASARILKFLRTENVKKIEYNNGLEPQILMKNCGFKFNESNDDNILSNINLNLSGNKLVMIVGKIGSGKTLLLKSLLNELTLSTGDMNIDGKLSYSPQKSMMLSKSVKDNILFGKEYNLEWYNKVIHCCGLKKDILTFPNNDETIIGEKGINLSGGQKCRINLARAIYQDTNIILLDDPLSSVDVNVSNHIFSNVFDRENGILKDKLTILVTHQIQYLPKSDIVIVMDNRDIINIGKYSELILQKNDNNNARNGRNSMDSIEFDKMTNHIFYDEIQTKDHQFIDPYTIKKRVNKRRSIFSIFRRNNDDNSDVKNEETSVLMTDDTVVDDIFEDENHAELSRPMVLFLRLFSNKSRATQILNMMFIFTVYVVTSIFQLSAEYSLSKWAVLGVAVTRYQYTWIMFIVFVALLCYVRSQMLYHTFIMTAIYLHDKMFKSVLVGKRKFFESNPIGRILNRFSKDQETIDVNIAATVGTALHVLSGMIIFIFIPLFGNPYMYIGFIICCLLYWYLIKKCIPNIVKLQNLNNIIRSYSYNTLETICDGVIVIRSLNYDEYILKNACKYIDKNFATQIIYNGVSTYVEYISKLVGFILIITALLLSVYYPYHPIFAGFMITYAFLIGYKVGTLLSMIASLSQKLISVDRVREYCNISQENIRIQSNTYTNDDEKFDGSIEFDNVSCKYRDTLKFVLSDVTFKIDYGLKVGICGQTGCGKSTLFLTLLRLIDVDKGIIKVNNKDISNMTINDLRNMFTVIPQTPVIFSNTIRYNLDPFNKYEYSKIKQTLIDICLYDVILKLEKGVDTMLSSKYRDINDDNNIINNKYNKKQGFQFSYGEAQLLCFGRALLDNKPYLLIDEGTSNVDNNTDKIIQELIQSNDKLKDKTIITIAHRVNTILNCDIIMSIHDGTVIEFDKPSVLLSKNINDNTAIFKTLHEQSKQHIHS